MADQCGSPGSARIFDHIDFKGVVNDLPGILPCCPFTVNIPAHNELMSDYLQKARRVIMSGGFFQQDKIECLLMEIESDPEADAFINEHAGPGGM